jgi:hypothetical protein
MDLAQVDNRNHILDATEPVWQDFLREVEDFIKQ